MHKRKHKRKVSRVVIFTSDAVDAKARQLKIHPWIINLLLFICCILVGGAIGYVANESEIWDRVQESIVLKDADIGALEEENSLLLAEIETLTEKITVLSETVNQKVQDAESLKEELAGQSMPTGFPLTGSASIEEITEGEPMCIFNGTPDITIIATASGVVTAIEDDEAYGHKITIDHGNGYVTIYRNSGDSKVKVGEGVAKGTTLYIIGANNTKLGYQVSLDGTLINPMDILSISG